MKKSELIFEYSKWLSYIDYYKNDNYFEMNKTYKERYSFE